MCKEQRKETVNKMHIFVNAYEKWRTIENDRDLKKQNLTLFDYGIVSDCLKRLSNINGERYLTICSSVANWFSKNGFNVNMDSNNVNYVISL